MQTLREMLSFESEHFTLKDRLAIQDVSESAKVSQDVFNAKFDQLQKMAKLTMEETKKIHERQVKKMNEVANRYKDQLKDIVPITEKELEPFLNALQAR